MRKSTFNICLVLVVTIALGAANPSCSCAGPSASATIGVNATFCGESWPGDLTYVLTCGVEDEVVGDTVPGSHSVSPGEWTCEYDFGGPSGSILVDITPSANQTVAADGTITFTLNFEQGQDASIEFVGWTINGELVPLQDSYDPDWYLILPGFNATIGAVYQQQVAGCEGLEVSLDESDWLVVWEVHYNATAPEPYLEPWLHVANNWCAVNKMADVEGTISEKASQYTTFFDSPVEACSWFAFNDEPPYYLSPWVAVDGYDFGSYDPHLILDAHTRWQLVKEVSYNKTVDWLNLTIYTDTGPWMDCILFDLVLFNSGCTDPVRLFVMSTEALVELVDDDDINTDNNWCDSAYKQLFLAVTNPYQVGGIGEVGEGWTEVGSDYDWQAKARHGGAGGWRACVDNTFLYTGGTVPWLNGGQMWFELVYDDSSHNATYTIYDSSDNSVLATVTDPSVSGFKGLIGMQAKTSSEAAGSVIVDNVKVNGVGLYGDDGFSAQGTDFVRDLKYLDISGVLPGSFILTGDLTFTWGAKATDEGPSLSIYIQHKA